VPNVRASAATPHDRTQRRWLQALVRQPLACCLWPDNGSSNVGWFKHDHGLLSKKAGAARPAIPQVLAERGDWICANLGVNAAPHKIDPSADEMWAVDRLAEFRFAKVTRAECLRVPPATSRLRIERVDIKIVDTNPAGDVMRRCALTERRAKNSLLVRPGPTRMSLKEVGPVSRRKSGEVPQIGVRYFEKRAAFLANAAHSLVRSLEAV
jgi:hypothetical protein